MVKQQGFPWRILVLQWIVALVWVAVPIAVVDMPSLWAQSYLAVAIWVLHPILAFITPLWAALRGIPALLAFLAPNAGLMLMYIFWHVFYAPGALLLGFALSILGAATGLEIEKRRG